MSRPAIVVDDISKSYKISHLAESPSTFRDAVSGFAASLLRRGGKTPRPSGSTSETFWALRDVSFSVEPGEVVGIIGRNGAGKSTLLKILSRITEPTTGVARIRGRLASLLEVGTGFHFELTGRENIYLNGSILGMRKAEIDRKFDEIIAFAEIERFLDTQVKYYSTGMFVRLAFAVAAHLETQILIVDEVLAVGDVAFQNKCLGRIEDVTKQGRTVLFVSHNVPAVQNLCTRCILLDRGQMVMDGEPESVLNEYNLRMGGALGADESLEHHPGRTSDSKPCMRWVSVAGRGQSESFIRMGDDLSIEVQFESPESDDPLTDVLCRANVRNNLNTPVFGFDTDVIPPRQPKRPFRRGRVTCRVERAPLMPGTYTLDLAFGSHRMVFDTVHGACKFEIHPADVFGTGRLPVPSAGNVFWAGRWEVSVDDEVGAASPSAPGAAGEGHGNGEVDRPA
jgi:lipopolysaccharide transport system ATP-binding protein